MAPTETLFAAYEAGCRDLAKAITLWDTIRDKDLSDLNAALGTHGLAALSMPGRALAISACNRQ